MRIYAHQAEFESDGDYITYGYWNDEGWWEVSNWMIPGTQLED